MALPLTHYLNILRINPVRAEEGNAALKLRQLVENANTRTHVTFWGTRMVTIGEETIPLDIIAAIVFRALDNPNVSGHTACVGWAITFLYEVTDIQIRSSNFITQFFVWLREDFCITILICGNQMRSHERSQRGVLW